MIELAPIRISGGLQRQVARPGSEPQVKAVERLLTDKAERDKLRPKSELFDAKFWKHIPITLGLSDPKEFATHAYYSPGYRAAERKLHLSETHALIKP